MVADSGPALLGVTGAAALLDGADGADGATGGGARFSLSLRSAFHVVASGAASGDASGMEAWAAAAGSAGRAGASRGRSAWGGTLRAEGALRYQAPAPTAATMATPMITSSAGLPLPAVDWRSAAGAGSARGWSAES
jgi:hypothetical protein